MFYNNNYISKTVMKNISNIKWNVAVLGLFVLIASCVGTLPAQTQVTGNRIFHVNNVPIKMVFVKGGNLQLGCTSERDDSCRTAEVPSHSVTLADFYIGETEITQAQWMAVMGRDNNPS